jgi:hypothetical protein
MSFILLPESWPTILASDTGIQNLTSVFWLFLLVFCDQYKNTVAAVLLHTTFLALALVGSCT